MCWSMRAALRAGLELLQAGVVVATGSGRWGRTRTRIGRWASGLWAGRPSSQKKKNALSKTVVAEIQINPMQLLGMDCWGVWLRGNAQGGCHASGSEIEPLLRNTRDVPEMPDLGEAFI